MNSTAIVKSSKTVKGSTSAVRSHLDAVEHTMMVASRWQCQFLPTGFINLPTSLGVRYSRWRYSALASRCSVLVGWRHIGRTRLVIGRSAP